MFENIEGNQINHRSIEMGGKNWIIVYVFPPLDGVRHQFSFPPSGPFPLYTVCIRVNEDITNIYLFTLRIQNLSKGYVIVLNLDYYKKKYLQSTGN